MLSQVEKKAGDCHFWAGLMSVKDQFINLGWFRLNNGTQIMFWKDKWMGHQAFKTRYPNLYNMVRKMQATVAEVLQSDRLNVSFRRALVGTKLTEWHSLVASIVHVTLNNMPNMFVWGLHKNGSFSVNSMYKFFVSSGLKVTQEIWQMKIPLKNKIFV